MLRKIIIGYGKLLLSLIKLLALVLLCTLFALLLVLPLWKFATETPQLYSFVVMILLICGLLFFTTKSLRVFLISECQSPQEKKMRVNHLLKNLGKFLTILGALLGIIFFIINELIIIAFLVLIIAIILYGVLAFGTKEEKHL